MKIFISYRRDDSAGYAGRLFDFLTAQFGENNIFMDIDTIEPGEDFRKVVKNAVATCDVVLVMIGKQWLSMLDAQGRRRLDDPRDWVRVEIAAALANPNVRVIPVLVRDANMPGNHELPDELKELSWRNAIELSDTRFQYDARKLIEVIERVAVKPVRIPAGGQRKSGVTRYWGVAISLVGLGVIIGVVMYGINSIGTLRTPTPEVLSISTNLPTLTLTPSLAPSPTFTFVPENVLSPAVQVVDLHFSSINDAINKDDLIRSWNLMTYNFQCNPSDKCEFSTYQDWWWQWHVSYTVYDCDPYTVVVRYILAPRNQPSSTSNTIFYERYSLIEENAVLKINEGHLIDNLDDSCTPVVDSQ